MPRRELFLLGSFQARLDGEPVAGLTAPRLQGLLAYLALEGEAAGPWSRDRLAAFLWPDKPGTRAAHSLRQGIYRLNKLLALPGRPAPLATTRQTVGLNPDANLWFDAAVLQAALAETAAHEHRAIARCPACCARLEEAVGFYRGLLLEGVVVESEPFEAWLRPQRQQLERAVLEALGHLVDHYQGREAWQKAEALAFRQVELAPWHERGHRQFMRALAAQGRRSDAIAHYDRMVVALRETLDVAPAEATEALIVAIRTGAFPATRSARRTRGLPPQHTPFVGRERDMDTIAARLVDDTCHLLTLVGPGGAGKSRLAIQAALAQESVFRDGAVFVPLAAAASAHLATAMLAALKIPLPQEQADGAEERLLAVLRQRELLLILDNYEHLLPETGLVRRILAEAPTVQLLVTSRQRLGLRAEWVLDVDGLSYPAVEGGGQAGEFDAVALFLALTQRLQPGFTPSPAGKEVVATLCRLVGGLPLALELAAALVRTRSVAEILAAVSVNLDVLATEMPDIDPRHRSLRAVFDHSWNLLANAEKAALRRIAIFRGDFTAEAAAAVAQAPPARLHTLVDKSLLRMEDDRYGLHPVLQQYVAERLYARPALALATATAHSRYYLNLLQDTTMAQDAVAADLDNLRAAWRQAVTTGRTEALSLALPGLVTFFVQAGYLEEGQATLAEAASRLRGEDTPDLHVRLAAEQLYFLYGLARYEETLDAAREVRRWGRATGDERAVVVSHLYTGAALARQGAYPEAGEAVDSARALAEEAGLFRLLADCLRVSGSIAVRLGDYGRAEQVYARSLALSRRESYTRGEANALGGLGNTALVQEDPLTARVRYEEALAIFAAANDELGAATVRNNLATSYWAVGDYKRAATILAENLVLRRQIGDRRGEGASLMRLGIQYHYQGDLVTGREHYQAALLLFRQIGYRRGEGEVLAHLCLLAHQEGDQVEAIRLGRTAASIARASHDRSDLGYTLSFLGHALAAAGESRSARAAYEEALALRRQLGEWNRTLEPLAGLAELALGAGDRDGALAHVEAILTHLAKGTLDVVDQPARVYLAGVRVLQAAGDPRAATLLRDGQALLRARAELLGEDGTRYLALPLHRAMFQIGSGN